MTRRGKWGILIGVVVAALLLAATTGCQSTGGLRGRLKDLMDCGSASVGVGLGLSVDVKVGDLMHPSIGVMAVTWRIGHQSRDITGAWEDFEGPFPGAVVALALRGLYLPGSVEDDDWLAGFVSTWSTLDGESWVPTADLLFGPGPDSGFHSATELRVGATIGVVGFRFGINPLEILDFALGFVAVDIAKDDAQEQSSALRRAPRPLSPEDVSRLIRQLGSSDFRAREDAASTLWKIGPGAKNAVPALARALEDKYWEVRCAAAMALGKIGPAAGAAAPALGRALGDRDSRVRSHVAWALVGIGPPAKRAVPALKEAVQSDKDEYVRQAAAHALGEIGPAAEEAVLALANLLAHQREGIRLTAAKALGKIGPAAKDAVPALKKLAQNDKPEYVRRIAAEALKKIQPEANDK